MNIYKFKLEAFDEGKKEVGIVAANNYAEALTKTVEYVVGVDELCMDNIYLKQITDSEVVSMDEEIIDKIAKEWIW